MRRIFLLAILTMSLMLLAYKGVPQDEVTSAWNVKQGGSALPNVGPLLAAATACRATAADLSYSKAATSALTCANTGEMRTGGWDQMTMKIEYNIGAGSAVWMQCDTELTLDGASWGFVPTEDINGNKGIRDWIWTTTANGAVTNNFPINAHRTRCRSWIVGGDADSKVRFVPRVASSVAR